MRPLRSLLYLPASNTRALKKARSLPCDAVILDLEDAVAPEAKDAARDQAIDALRAGFRDRLTVLRVNSLESRWGAADLRAAVDAGPDAVLAPKVDAAAHLQAYDAALAGAPGRTRLWAMVETPAAVLHLGEIAACAQSTRLSGLVVGLNDLAVGLHARHVPGRAPFAAALSTTVTAARAHGLFAVDAVFNDLEDDAALEAECRQARDFGFDGKSLIHPRQIEIANRAFAPSEAELAWARAVTAAFADPANSGQGALRVEGAMVERLHLRQAERWLALAS